MSIENDLGRIATSLEAIAKHLTADKQPTNQVVPAPTAAKVKKSDKPTETAAPIEAEVDPFAEAAAPAAEEVSLENLSELLKRHAKLLGTKLTIALIIKHGADKVTPKIATIPQANFTACFNEALSDIAKVTKKG